MLSSQMNFYIVSDTLLRVQWLLCTWFAQSQILYRSSYGLAGRLAPDRVLATIQKVAAYVLEMMTHTPRRLSAFALIPIFGSSQDGSAYP